jgi:integrase
VIIVQTKHLIVKTRYYVNNNGQHSYQRAIPKDLRQFFDNKANIVRKLKGSDKNMAAEIARLASEDDRLFAELRGGAGVLRHREALANALLARFGLRPGAGLERSDVPEGMHDQPHLTDIEHYLEMRRADGAYDEVDQVARLLLTNSVPLMFSGAMEIYLQHHERGSDPKFRRAETNRWNRIMEVIEDVPISTLSRSVAHAFVESRRKSVTTSTVERELKAIRAVLNVVIRERELAVKNPFESVKVPGLGDDATRRLPFTLEEHRAIVRACLVKPDEIRLIALLCCVTGARIGEIVGLRLSDVVLASDVPHIRIVNHEHRSLKTKGSNRLVPLVPQVVKPIQEHSSTVAADALFARYWAIGESVRSDSASVAVNKFVDKYAPGKTIHCARHAMKDLMRNANVTRDLMQEIGGWGKRQVDDDYGLGRAMEMKLRALVDSLEPVFFGATGGSISLNTR